MAIAYIGTGAWSEVFTSGPLTVNIPAHQAGDHATLVVAALTTGMAAPGGWTQVGIEYVEGVLFWTVFERILPTTEAGTTTDSVAFPGTAGAGALVAVLRGPAVSSALVFQDDNTSDAFGVIPTITAPGFYLNFTAIYAARTTFGSTPKVTLQSGTATGTVAEQSFQSVLTGGYRMAVATLDLSAASSAIYAQRWAGGNTNSNALRVALFEPVAAAASGTVTIASAVSGAVTKRVPASGTVAAVSTVSGAGVKLTAPGLPAELTATIASPTSVALSWTAVPGATSYEVAYRTTVGGSNQFATTAVPSRTITGLTNGVEYWFKVRAINSAGSSAYTDAVFITLTAGAAGYVIATSTVTGSVTKRVPASGRVVATSAVSGNVTKRVRASGTVAAVSSVSGSAAIVAPPARVPGAIVERALRDHLRVEILDPASGFALDLSVLNDGVLGAPGDLPVWTDWSDRATGLTIRRGGDRDGIAVVQRPGLTTITLYDYTEFDPTAPVFAANRQLRITQLTTTREPRLFTGKVRDVDITYMQPYPGATHVPVTVVTVVDAVADHDRVTRYGAMPETGSETFGSRIRRLTASATVPVEQPDVQTYYDYATGANEVLLGRTVLESSLANHLTVACSTVGALWWVGGDGITRFTPRRGARYADTPDAVIRFTSAFGDGDPADLHGIDATIAAGSRATYTVGVAHNLNAVPDPDNPGQWLADETDHVYREPSGEIDNVRLGRSPVTTTINAANPALHRLWEQQLAYAIGSEQIVTVLWNAQEDLDRVADLDIGNVVHIWHPIRGLHQAQIIGVQHTITPTRWMLQLTLIGGTLYDL